VSIENDIAFFERVPSLRLIGRDALRVLAIGAESRYLDAGEVLFHAGDAADSGYIIQEGSFTLKPGTSGDGPGIIASPGMLLGELALLAETERPATAIAREPSAVIRLTRNLFLRMLESFPDAAVKLREQLIVRATQSVKDIEKVRARLDTSEAPK
jgi:CRP-like cAMP-binding protein